MLTYVLRNESYIEPLRKETEAAFDGDALVDLDHLQSNCPLLEAVWFETLRLASNAASVRRVAEDTVIGGKLLKKDSRVSKFTLGVVSSDLRERARTRT